MHAVKFGLLLFTLFFSSIGLCYDYYADDDDYSATTGTGTGAGAVVNFSTYGREVSKFVTITAESFKKAAVIGLINHRWRVTKISDDEVTGVLKEQYEAKIVRVKRGGQATSVRISISGPRIQQKWADIIRREMAVALVLLSQ